MKRISLLAVFGVVALTAISSLAIDETAHPKQLHWPFDGYFGKVDRQAAQRGFQVYKEVCSSCHSLNRVSIRQLADLGFSEAETKALAASYTVQDGPNESGDMFDRPGRPSDKFPGPFANDNAARASNGGVLPPDLSLITKARHDGPNYVHSLLTGYKETTAPEAAPPATGQAAAETNTESRVEAVETTPASQPEATAAVAVAGPTLYANPYFPGGQIAMPPPLLAGQVSYEDGTEASVDQMARDVVIFLQWAAEPEMEHRKSMGLKVLVFLLIMTGFLYAAKRRIWGQLEH